MQKNKLQMKKGVNDLKLLIKEINALYANEVCERLKRSVITLFSNVMSTN